MQKILFNHLWHHHMNSSYLIIVIHFFSYLLGKSILNLHASLVYTYEFFNKLVVSWWLKLVFFNLKKIPENSVCLSAKNQFAEGRTKVQLERLLYWIVNSKSLIDYNGWKGKVLKRSLKVWVKQLTF